MFFRKMMKYPPKAHVLAILCIGRDEAKTEQFCGRVALTAKQFAKEHTGEYVAVIGPTKASIAKSNDFYRNLIYIKADNYDILTKLASALDSFREQDKNMILQMDFDPMGSY
jgi:primosomal protein N' (replication factor Y)